MPETKRPGILLIDDDADLQHALKRLLRPLQHTVHATSSPGGARELLQQHIGVIICEPRDERLATFLIEARESHPDVVRLILTGYPDLHSVLRAVNQAHPFKLLVKPWLNEELLDTVNMALQQFMQNRENGRLLKEYNGILSTAEAAHAFRVLDALMHSIHTDIAMDALRKLPVGACLLANGIIRLCNAPAGRFLQDMGHPLIREGEQTGQLPPVLRGALDTERRKRVRLRINDQQRLDYFVLELSAGTLIAFAPEPRLGRPPDQ